MAFEKIKVTNEELLQAREEGLNDTQIAKKFGIAASTVAAKIGKRPREVILAERVASANALRKRKTTSDEDMLKLRDEGWSNHEIAELLKITYRTVLNRIGPEPKKKKETKTPEKKVKTEKPKPVKVEAESAKVEEPKAEEKVVKAWPIPSKNVMKTPQNPSKNVISTPKSAEPKKWPPTISPEMFAFAICDNWGEKLAKLAEMAFEEKWRFLHPVKLVKHADYQILESYILRTFWHRATAYNTTPAEVSRKHFIINTKFACFHTGLYSRDLKSIYAYFEPAAVPGPRSWFFVGWVTDTSETLQRIRDLPKDVRTEKEPFHPEYEIRPNLTHVLTSTERLARLPESVRNAWNLPLLIETAVERSRRMAIADRLLVADGTSMGKQTKLLPLYLTKPDRPDAAMFLEEADGFYLGSTILTLEQAYFDARVAGRVSVDWLRRLVEE